MSILTNPEPQPNKNAAKQATSPRPQAERPLAEKIRPAELSEFIGQSHLRDRLDSLLSSRRLPSLLLFGPPGCGKSTLALLLARAAEARGLGMRRVSAPETGLTALRKELEGVQVLVLDELHRYSKAQQDFFLPILESGEITLIATTTENPSFSVTRQLLSRLHVLRLRPLSDEELLEVARRGAAAMEMELDNDALKLLAAMAGGDARTLLNLVEYVAELPEEARTPETMRSRLPEIVFRGDKQGDNHYELASALIKSIRGSDPDAALYYLACMLETGEDPRFICRRLILSASEDIGLGDPYALSLAVSTQQAVEFTGMPEGFIPLSECVVYLACAPKNNSTYAAYLSARETIRREGPKPVPLHLRNASTQLQKQWGYGRGYKYPHCYEEGWVEQDYLPHGLEERRFYEPRDIGMEKKLSTMVRRYRQRMERHHRTHPPTPPTADADRGMGPDDEGE